MQKRFASIVIATILLSGCQSQFDFSNEEGTTINENQSVDDKTSNEDNIEKGLTLPAQYFNQVVEANGKKIIQNPENQLLLVNKSYYLADDYIPQDLVRANVEYSFGDEQVEKALLKQVAATALEEMFNAAKNQGIELFAVSGYRSYVRQEVVFNAEVAKSGIEKAKEAVANPGQSEHQTGLTMDISSRSVALDLTQEFENTTEGKWLAENAHKYGFILRYPKGKENITGYKYEPWHFRYVGKEFSKIIYENQLTLEEYFNLVKEI